MMLASNALVSLNFAMASMLFGEQSIDRI